MHGVLGSGRQAHASDVASASLLRRSALQAQRVMTTPRVAAAKNAIADIYNAEDKEHAAAAIKAFAKQNSAKFP
jgi:hypothetical protein